VGFIRHFLLLHGANLATDGFCFAVTESGKGSVAALGGFLAVSQPNEAGSPRGEYPEDEGDNVAAKRCENFCGVLTKRPQTWSPAVFLLFLLRDFALQNFLELEDELYF